MKIHLGINGKMLKGYNEFIQYITTLISTSTRMSSIKSPHESWGRLAKEIQNYEKEYGEFLLVSDGKHLLEISDITSVHCLQEDMVWATISSPVVSVLWKARCKCVFQKVQQNTVDLVKEINACTYFKRSI